MRSRSFTLLFSSRRFCKSVLTVISAHDGKAIALVDRKNEPTRQGQKVYLRYEAYPLSGKSSAVCWQLIIAGLSDQAILGEGT